MLPKIPEFYFLNISALRVGCVLSPASTMLTTKDLVYRFKALNPVCVIAHDSVADTVEEAAECLPTLKQKVIVSKSPNKKFGWFDLNHIQLNSDDHKCAVTRSDESMAVFFTSGTTGYPKMVEHTHASFPLSLGDLGKYTLDLNSDNMSWSIADTGWGLTAYSIFSTWSRGACLFIHEMPRFSPQTILQMLSKYPIDSFVAPPLVYKSLLAENIASHKLSKLEHCCCGGEALNPEIIRKWRASTGLKIHNVYGQTESTALITCRKTFEYREGSLGKPVPGMKVTIVDENEEELGVGVIGEIVAERKNAVGLFKGYKDNPKATKAVLTEKYFHSGDLGYYDKDGYFWYAGRNDDLINSAGYRIGPVEVENALMEHSAVREVAVISSPDSKRGEVVKAFIILNESVKPSEALINELQDHCKRMTAPYKYPRKIEFVSDMPKTISGKILRKELKQREWKNS
nr:acyl-coenzyme A synthetase ACSM3, mitochondrial [Parasteatoda tepidariorum]